MKTKISLICIKKIIKTYFENIHKIITWQEVHDEIFEIIIKKYPSIKESGMSVQLVCDTILINIEYHFNVPSQHQRNFDITIKTINGYITSPGLANEK